ncbi:MAG: UDP-N-acetylmuramate dehydrogenase [Nitrospirota bacterium]|nr:UDP-N-acetylmuramate dehydrogenase [Nitrospirota bacterium]
MILGQIMPDSMRRRTISHRPATFHKRDLHAVVSGVRGDIRFNAPLREYTSFRIGGPADVLVTPAEEADLCRLVRQSRVAKIPIFVLGGTNLLVRDKGIRGVVVSLAKLTAVKDDGDSVVYAEGGVGMPTLMRHAIGRSLSGLEWAAGIPGTVAGCVIMNAGTRLGQMQDVVKAVRVVDAAGRIVEWPASSIRFSYRRARLPRGVIAGVWLQLKPAPRERIQTVVKDYLAYRKATQPLTLPNAGCVFKNPGRETAGRLIEAVGLKGLRVGDAHVSEKHANFIVNRGRAQAADVMALIKEVGRTVETQMGVTLELELKIVGQP